MAKIWSWAFLGSHNTTPQPVSSPHRTACQFTSNSHSRSNYDQFKSPSMEQAHPKPMDPEPVEHLLITEMAMNKVDTDAGRPNEAEVTQMVPGNATPPRKDTNRQHVPSSLEPSQTLTQPDKQEGKREEETEIGLEKKGILKIPKTPVLSRLPTPDLSDLECGSFCACCGDTEDGHDIAVKK